MPKQLGTKPQIEETNFYESIRQTIKENRHVEYLQTVLKDYEEYKKLFDEGFTNQIHIADIDYAKHPKLKFTFDFGDGHEFDVELKSRRDFEKTDQGVRFPHAVDQRGIAPEQYPSVD